MYLQPWLIVRSILRPARRDERGAVAILVAFAAVAGIGMAALAIDTSAAISAKTELDLAADAASLAGLRSATFIYNQDARPSPGKYDQAVTEAKLRFQAQAGGISSITTPSVDVTITQDGPAFTANVKYATNFNTSLMKILGAISPSYTSVATIRLGGVAETTERDPAYVDIQVLLDVSNSMTIGANLQDRLNILEMTKTNFLRNDWWNTWGGNGNNCALACHTVESPATNTAYPNSNLHWGVFTDANDWSTYAGYPDWYYMARANGYTMRIDVTRAAVGEVAADLGAANSKNETNYLRFGLSTFDTNYRKLLDPGDPLAAPPVISAVEVTPIYPPWNQTQVGQSIRAFADDVGPSGDGTAPAKAIKYVFIITDGIEDVTASDGWSRLVSVFDPSSCDALKAKGVTIMVLHTDNLPDGTVASMDQDYIDAAKKLPLCASGGLYFEAASPQQIHDQVRVMVNLAVSSPARFTK